MPADIRCVRIKLKQGSLDAVRTWQIFLKDHKQEVIETLKEEGVSLEAAFLDQIGTDHFLIYIMVCRDFEKAKQIARESNNIVDFFHRKFKQDWWDERMMLETLIHFEA